MLEADKIAADGLALIKQAILAHLALHPEGLGNSQIARELGLESDFNGKQRNYLSWSVIGLLVNEGRLTLVRRGRSVFYKIS